MHTTDTYTYHPVSQLSAEWHELRAGRITASLAAACCGASPWMSPQEAYRSIQGDGMKISNWYMEHGREMEPAAVEIYEVQSGLLCRGCGFWVSTERPWLGASPDRQVGRDGLLEVKCGDRVYSDPAVSWLIQGSVQLYCSDRLWCDIAHYRDGEIAAWRLDRSLIPLILPRLDWFRESFLVPGRIPARREVPRWEIPRAILDASYARCVFASPPSAGRSGE